MTAIPFVELPVGSEGIDFAWWRPVSVKPWSYVVRYICKLPNGKAVTRAEIDRYHAEGVAVLLVWEQSADDWARGKALGLDHGRRAVAFAMALGYPLGAPILFAFDTNAVPGDSRALQYGSAAADAVQGAGFTFGPYGDLDVIKVLAHRSSLNWLAGATSWSDPTKPYQPETMPGYELVHVRQVISGSTPNYDRNITLRPFPGWLPHAEVIVPPVEVEPPIVVAPGPVVIVTEEEEPMQYVADSRSQGSAVVTLATINGKPGHLMAGFDTPEERAVYAAVLPIVAFDDATYLAMSHKAGG